MAERDTDWGRGGQRYTYTPYKFQINRTKIDSVMPEQKVFGRNKRRKKARNNIRKTVYAPESGVEIIVIIITITK